MDTVTLSVVIPCFNAANTIEVQLQSLARQQYNHPWELLIADNGSTDNTLEIVKRYQDQFPNLRIIDASGKKGASYARNTAVDEAKGHLIAFCDADDKVHGGWLAAIATALKDHHLVAGKLRLVELNEPWRIPTNHPFETTHSPQEGVFTYRHAPHLKYSPASNLGVRKEVHMAINGFDEAILGNEDMDYCLRAQKANYRLHFAPDAVVEYRLRHNLWTTYIQFYKWSKYSILVFRKNVGKGTLIERLRFIFGGWKYLPGKILKIRKKADLFQFAEYLGSRFGEMQGCFEFLLLGGSGNTPLLKTSDKLFKILDT